MSTPRRRPWASSRFRAAPASTRSSAAGRSVRFSDGGGNDILTGGSGVNYYYFNTALNGATNDPTITNFHVGSDHIKLAHAIFTALPTGVLPGADFKIGIGTGATAPSEHILYNSGTGALMCDSDGNGAAAAVQFAQLSTGLGLTASSFTVY